MLHKKVKPSELININWRTVFPNQKLAVAAAALIHCLVQLGDSFEDWFEARDLKDVAEASVKLQSFQPFLERQLKDGWKYRVSVSFLKYVLKNADRAVA